MSFKQEYLTRQAEIIPTDKQGLTIAIVGAGAIGSFTALALAKMGFLNLLVFDDDEVSTENMNCQFYKPADIGMPKVEALKGMIWEFTGVNIEAVNSRITDEDTLHADIVISSVDDMAARKTIHEISNCKYLIDPRMAAEYSTLEVLDYSSQEQIANYEKTLYTNEESVHERCTAKATMYTVMLIAGQIAKVVKDIALGEKYIKTFDWDIKHNRLTAFASDSSRLQ